MKKTAEEILKETINSINESDRWVIDRKGIKYVREDIVLKAISNVSLPPVSEEEIRSKIDEFLSNCSEFERSKWDEHVVEITHLDYSLLVDFIVGLSRLPQREVEQPEEKKEEKYPTEFVKWMYETYKEALQISIGADINDKRFLSLKMLYEYWKTR